MGWDQAFTGDEIVSTEQQPDDNFLHGIETAPTVFAEGYRGISLRQGNISINLFANRANPVTREGFKAAAAVLTMPFADFSIIADKFIALRDELQVMMTKAAEEATQAGEATETPGEKSAEATAETTAEAPAETPKPAGE